jgi:hypothetical protein
LIYSERCCQIKPMATKKAAKPAKKVAAKPKRAGCKTKAC